MESVYKIRQVPDAALESARMLVKFGDSLCTIRFTESLLMHNFWFASFRLVFSIRLEKQDEDIIDTSLYTAFIHISLFLLPCFAPPNMLLRRAVALYSWDLSWTRLHCHRTDVDGLGVRMDIVKITRNLQTFGWVQSNDYDWTSRVENKAPLSLC